MNSNSAPAARKYAGEMPALLAAAPGFSHITGLVLGMERTEWNIVTKWKLTGFGIGVSQFILLVLEYDTPIAAKIKTVGWLGMIAACAWIGWRTWRDRNRSESQTDFPLSAWT